MALPYVITACTAGVAARQILAELGRGAVIGLSSRGAFLRVEPSGPDGSGRTPSWIVFLSREPFRGPLTINLEPAALEHLSLAQGETFTIQDATIDFERPRVRLRIDGVQPWSAAPRPENILPAQERQALLARVSQAIRAERDLPELEQWSLPSGTGAGENPGALSAAERSRNLNGVQPVKPAPVGSKLGRLLAHRSANRNSGGHGALGGWDSGTDAVSTATAQGAPYAELIPTSDSDIPANVIPSARLGGAKRREAISPSADKATAQVEYLTALLGRGPGLTPAGDDVVLGFLLALARWGDVLCPALPASRIAPPLIEAGRQRTTSLSVQLLKCAAQGQADERLILALDGLISSVPGEDSIIHFLLDWGHTSGAAALQGMLLLGG